ncbi:MAG: response regulator [Fibrobacteres bacterium]|nr:response regulator [Fibrobacterota bacterium]
MEAAKPSGMHKPSETVILVVEDDESLLRLSTHVLEMAGYRVIPMPESESALHRAKSRRDETIHILLTDVRMDPHMSGARLAHLLRQERPDLKIIYMTGFPASEIVLKEATGGQAALLRKPFTPTVLLDAVRKCLDPTPAPIATTHPPAS